MTDHCPVCGAPVKVVTADEGTSCYEPLGEGVLQATSLPRVFTSKLPDGAEVVSCIYFRDGAWHDGMGNEVTVL